MIRVQLVKATMKTWVYKDQYGKYYVSIPFSSALIPVEGKKNEKSLKRWLKKQDVKNKKKINKLL